MKGLALYEAILILVFSVGYRKLNAQQSYPVLDHNVTFAELKNRSKPISVKWNNPDKSEESLDFIEWEIPITLEMKKLTSDFLRNTYQLGSIWMSPQLIVFHAMGDGDLQNCLEVSSFLNDKLPDEWGTLSRAGKLPNGAHFIIDRDGTIYCLSPPVTANGRISYVSPGHQWIIKRHQDGNPVALGIENVSPSGDINNLTIMQIESNAKLARWLIAFENNKIRHLSSHHQFNDERNYHKFLHHFKLQNFQQKWRTKSRRDIGDENLKKITENVKSFGITCQDLFD